MKKPIHIFFILVLLVSSFFSSCTPTGGQESPILYSENLEYALNEDGNSYSVIGFGDWEGTELVIPSEHNGLPVTVIEDYAFHDDYYLRPIPAGQQFDQRQHTVMITKAVIPNTVQNIGAFAFFNCIFLETVVLPDSVTTIEECAFAGCTALRNVHLPNSVQTLGMGTFLACKSLANIHIPESVTSIGVMTFTGCVSLTKIDVDKNNQQYTSISNNLYSKDGKTLIQYAQGQNEETFTMPNTVENVQAGAFAYGNTLKQINLSTSMTKIGEYALSNCYALSAVNIPTSVTRIEEGAFSSCYSLTAITIPASVTYISDDAFSACHSFMEIYNKASADVCAELPYHIITDESQSYIKHVGDFVFYDDGTDVYFIKYLGNETNITLPQYGDCMPYGIYDYAFYDTVRDYNTPVLMQIMAGGNSTITSITIPDYVISIGNYAFSGCTLLESIIIPKSVTKMGAYVFAGCSNIKLYCESKPHPEGWDLYWNSYHPQRPVIIPAVWNYTSE